MLYICTQNYYIYDIHISEVGSLVISYQIAYSYKYKSYKVLMWADVTECSPGPGQY